MFKEASIGTEIVRWPHPRKVALVWRDGPATTTTPRALDSLRRYQSTEWWANWTLNRNRLNLNFYLTQGRETSCRWMITVEWKMVRTHQEANDSLSLWPHKEMRFPGQDTTDTNHKEKDKLAHTEIKNSYLSEAIKIMKKQAREWEKIFITHNWRESVSR